MNVHTNGWDSYNHDARKHTSVVESSPSRQPARRRIDPAAYPSVRVSSSHPPASAPQLARTPWPDEGGDSSSVQRSLQHSNENQYAGRSRLQMLVPVVPTCTSDGYASPILPQTAPRSRGSRRSLRSEHSASGAQPQIEAISVQDGRAQAPPPTPCLIRNLSKCTAGRHAI